MRLVQQLRPHLATAQRLLVPYLWNTLRRARQHPFLALLVSLFAFSSFALSLFWIGEHSGLGRWWWNYAVTFHPALAYILPWVGWSAVEGRPRWIQEIYDSRWPGDWEVPVLSPPQYASMSGHGHHGASAHSSVSDSGTDAQPTHDTELDFRSSGGHGNHLQLVSPAILKLHIFSTASDKAYHKRQLIRSMSPMDLIPPEYRHLVEMKFVLGYSLLNDGWDGVVNETAEAILQDEQARHGDLFRMEGLYTGENLREGKILQWIRDVGQGKHSPRQAWYLFKLDDDAIVNLPNLLNLLLSLDVNQPTYLGTSLARWPSYHFHFTGFLTGFNHGVYRTLSEGISKMSKEDIQWGMDDDVLTGEIMWSLPSAPQCRPLSHDHSEKDNQHHHGASPAHEREPASAPQPDYCSAQTYVAPWGWQPPPPNPDPRTNLNRHDFVRHAADPDWVGAYFPGANDLATHSWWFKQEKYYRREWKKRLRGAKVWDPPDWIKAFADPGVGADR